MTFGSEFSRSWFKQFLELPSSLNFGSEPAPSNHKPMYSPLPLEYVVKHRLPTTTTVVGSNKPLQRGHAAQVSTRSTTPSSPYTFLNKMRPYTAPSKPTARTDSGGNGNRNRLPSHVGKKLNTPDNTKRCDKRPKTVGNPNCSGDDSLNNRLKGLETETVSKPISTKGCRQRKEKDNANVKEEKPLLELYRSRSTISNSSATLIEAKPRPKSRPNQTKKPSFDSDGAKSEFVSNLSCINTDVPKAGGNGIKNNKTKSKDVNANPNPETANEEKQQPNEADLNKPIELWQKCYVYCDPQFTEDELETIDEALYNLVQVVPKIHFYYLEEMPKKGSRLDYIWIKKGDKESGCTSPVGKQGGAQIINLECPECMVVDTVIHEVVHALGLEHEHQRPDRDEHINILWKNIQEGKESHFEKLPASRFPTLAFGFPYDKYDIKSITHYASYDGSKNGRATISNMNRKLFPPRVKLTKLDILKLQAMYKCVDKKVLNSVLKTVKMK